ncbi:MAG TPA: hypothetical protein VND64_37040 [Pirellulales bacterium]|nr:hypothetical protein [Pirellulales bacterium]
MSSTTPRTPDELHDRPEDDLFRTAARATGGAELSAAGSTRLIHPAADPAATAETSRTVAASPSNDPAADEVYEYLSCWHMTRELRWRPYGRA